MPDTRDPWSQRFSRVLEDELRRRATRLPRRRRAWRLGAAASALSVVAIAIVLVSPAANRSTSQAQALTAVLHDGTTVSLKDTLSADRLTGVARSLRESGLTLRLRQVAVGAPAEGRVLEVEWPTGVRFEDGRAVVPRAARGDVTVTVGRAARPGEVPGARGLSMLEANPQLCPLVDPADAPRTVRQLREAGYGVSVVRVEFRMDASGKARGPVEQVPIDRPGPGTVVVTVADSHFGVSKNPKNLALEVVDRERLPKSEPLGIDTACS